MPFSLATQISDDSSLGTWLSQHSEESAIFETPTKKFLTKKKERERGKNCRKWNSSNAKERILNSEICSPSIIKGKKQLLMYNELKWYLEVE